MSTPTTSKKTPARIRAKRPSSIIRAAKSGVAVDQTDESPGAANQPARHLPSRKPEQLMILIAAIIFGLVGLFIHVLVIASIVLVALLLGLIESEARSARWRRTQSEVLNEAKTVIEDFKKSGQVDSENSSEMIRQMVDTAENANLVHETSK